MNFEETLRYLLSLGHEMLAIKLGLRNTELLLEALGDPHHAYESVQIAGTNGKGSTAVMLDAICRTAGISTGLYTSPHLVSITERIRINGIEISEERFARYATEISKVADNLLRTGRLAALPTFFEHVTAIALLAFKDAGVRLAILETGLGGRLDATTVAGAQTVAITPVALDHQEYLGETLEEIAGEKAGDHSSGRQCNHRCPAGIGSSCDSPNAARIVTCGLVLMDAGPASKARRMMGASELLLKRREDGMSTSCLDCAAAIKSRTPRWQSSLQSR